jgi:hypothetical protein
LYREPGVAAEQDTQPPGTPARVLGAT